MGQFHDALDNIRMTPGGNRILMLVDDEPAQGRLDALLRQVLRHERLALLRSSTCQSD